MPQVQFARADLPWLFTPAAPGTAKTRLRPWLVLITVRRQDGVRLDPAAAAGARARHAGAAELPDLTQSWAWAHAQISGLGAGARPADVLTSDPGRACSRLVCPRHLEPDTAYLACLVPAFKIGVKAGLGEPVLAADEATLEPAWTASTTGRLRLPVYHAWEFATGAGGQLRDARPAPASQPARSRLGAAAEARPAARPAAGCRPAAVDRPAERAARARPGRRRRPGRPARAVPDGARAACSNAPPDVLAPPIYGQLQAGERAAGCRPRRLAARAQPGSAAARRRRDRHARRAGAPGAADGARVGAGRRGQRRQRAAAPVPARARARHVVMERHLAPLRPPELLAMTQPAHAQIQLASATVDGELRASRVPEAVVSGAMRRLASPQGLIARRAGAAAQTQINLLAAVDQVAMSPPPAAPNGMVVMASVAALTTDGRHAAGAVSRRAAGPAARAPGARDDGARAHDGARRRARRHLDAARSARTGRHRAALQRADVRRAAARSRRGCSCPASSTSRPTASRCWRRRRG